MERLRAVVTGAQVHPLPSEDVGHVVGVETFEGEAYAAGHSEFVIRDWGFVVGPKNA